MAFDITSAPANLLDSYRNIAFTNTKVLLGQAGPLGVYGMLLNNKAAAVTFVQFFNAATTGAVTLGTTVPDFTVMVKASDVFYMAPERLKKLFPLGCVVAATTTEGGSTAPATAMTADIWFTQRP